MESISSRPVNIKGRLKKVLHILSEMRSDSFGNAYGIADFAEGNPELERALEMLMDEVEIYDLVKKKLNNLLIKIDTCVHCSMRKTQEGHDGCIGFLDGVKNACCGHGKIESAYIQFDHENYKEQPNKHRIAGIKALRFIQQNREL